MPPIFNSAQSKSLFSNFSKRVVFLTLHARQRDTICLYRILYLELFPFTFLVHPFLLLLHIIITFFLPTFLSSTIERPIPVIFLSYGLSNTCCDGKTKRPLLPSLMPFSWGARPERRKRTASFIQDGRGKGVARTFFFLPLLAGGKLRGVVACEISA